jgi:putative membrane protein
MAAISAILSALHLLALAIGLPAVVLRALALRAASDPAALRRALAADAAWGIAAVLWLVTGPARAFGPLEKGTAFYLSSPLFYAKLGLFLSIFLLEIAPMATLIRWRMALGRGESPDLGAARLFATVSWIEAALVVTIVFVASFMARGFGLAPRMH